MQLALNLFFKQRHHEIGPRLQAVHHQDGVDATGKLGRDVHAQFNLVCAHLGALPFGSGFGDTFWLGQLRPDGLPIIRTQVAASHSANSGALDGGAMNWLWRCAASQPITDSRRNQAELSGQFPDAADYFDGIF